MKRLLAFVFLLFFCFTGIAQEVELTVWAVDARNDTDSVRIGINLQATIGIDTSLGERNYFGQRDTSRFELNSIQRAPALHECNYYFFASGDSLVTFRENANLKSDFRGLSTVQDSSIFRQFEIKLTNAAYPVKFRLFNKENHLNIYDTWSILGLPDCDNQTLRKNYHIGRDEMSRSEDFLIVGDSIEKFIILFDFHQSIKPQTSVINISPNPARNYLHITLPEEDNGVVRISGLDGKTYAEKSFQKDATIRFDLPSGLPNGIYMLHVVGSTQVSRSARFIHSK